MINLLTGPEEICDIGTFTKPRYLLPAIPHGLSPLANFQHHEKLWKDSWHTHVSYFADPDKNRTIYPLPTNQPRRPKEWSPEAWTDRRIVGYPPFHMFMPAPNAGGRLNRPFICRVTEKVDGVWFYENIGAESAKLREELRSWWNLRSHHEELCRLAQDRVKPVVIDPLESSSSDVIAGPYFRSIPDGGVVACNALQIAER